jgi:hypothetical protein
MAATLMAHPFLVEDGWRQEILQGFENAVI